MSGPTMHGPVMRGGEPAGAHPRRRTVWLAAGAAALGIALLVVALVVDPRQALAGYLAAHAAVVSVALGALFLLAVGLLLRAAWLAPWQGHLHALAGLLPLLAVLFVPVAAGIAVLYPWVAAGESLQAPLAQRVRVNSAWFNAPFWLARAAIYFVVWIALAMLLRRRSREAGAHGRLAPALALLTLVLTGSFAAFDWLKSLEPHWTSGIYGLRVLASGVTGALAALAVIGLVRARAGDPERSRTSVPAATLGALLLTAVLVWGYFVIPPLIIVWTANLPVEVSWYVPRMRTSWGAVGLVLIAGHLIVPGLLLLVREARTRVATVGLLGAFLLVMHVLDVYWLVLPATRPAGAMPHLGDVAGPLLIAGTLVAWRASALRAGRGW